MNELTAEAHDELEKRYRATLFVVLAQIVFTIVLTIAAWFAVSPTEGDVSPNSLLTIWGVVLFIAVGSMVLRRVLFRWERLKNIALLKGVSGVLAALQTNAIVLAAVAELVAIGGFVIAMLGDFFSDMLRATGVALIIFAFNFPRKSVWKTVVANLQGV